MHRYCPLQHRFTFTHHIFSAAHRKQLHKLNSHAQLPCCIIPGGTVAPLPPGTVRCTTCPAIQAAPAYLPRTDTEVVSCGCLCLLFRGGQLIDINWIMQKEHKMDSMQKEPGFSYTTKLL